MVGAMFRQCAISVAFKAAAQQYDEANPKPRTSKSDHMADFARVWHDIMRAWLAELSKAERKRYVALRTDVERDAFRILRNWSQTSKPDFYAHCATLAARLQIGMRQASRLRDRFCVKGILRRTAKFVPCQ
jgi:hypothetical protein